MLSKTNLAVERVSTSVTGASGTAFTGASGSLSEDKVNRNVSSTVVKNKITGFI